MSCCTVTQKMKAFNDYIASVPNRDRVMSIVQFAAMAMADPAACADCPKLSRDCKTILNLVAQYRAITRFSQWFVVGPQLTPEGIREEIRKNPCPIIGVLKTVSTAFFTVFLLGEEINLFSKYNIVSRDLGAKWNRIRYVFLFWSNIARTIMNILLLKRSTYNPVKDANDKAKATDHQRKKLSVWDGVLQTMFAYCLLKGSVPAGPKHMLSAFKSGNVVDIVTSFAPPVVIVPSTPHGILGIIAAIPGFKMSVL